MAKNMLPRALQGFLLVLLLALPTAAHAEKMVFDYRLYTPLSEALNSDDAGLILFNNDNPRYIIDLIAIRGKSAEEWAEALEIIVRTPKKDVQTIEGWAREIEGKLPTGCAIRKTEIHRDENSVTFSQDAPNCQEARSGTTIIRILKGKKSLFMLRFLIKGEADEATKDGWRAVLATARIE